MADAPAVWSSAKLLEFDFCVAPEAKILQSDLTWSRADQTPVGTEIIGFDETLGAGNRFRRGKVTGAKVLTLPRVKVTTTHGTIVVAANHRFVAKRAHLGANRQWIEARKLSPGMLMAFLTSPWEVEQTWDAGWLAGFFDGEGWLTRTSVGYAQNPGPTLAFAQRLLTERQFTFFQTKSTTTNAQCELTQGMREALRFLGQMRPQRLLTKAASLWENRRTWSRRTPLVAVLSVEPLEDGPVVALSTTTGTYISDGFFSHNCGIEQVLMGWFMRTPKYIRIAKLGTHALVAAQVLAGQRYGDYLPADLTKPDHEISAYLKTIKKSKDAHVGLMYDQSKRTVHGTAYGLTTFGMVRNFPKTFPTLKAAEGVQATYFTLAPEVPTFHTAVRHTAYEQKYLGGAEAYEYHPAERKVIGHPYGYLHRFYSVVSYERLSLSQKLWREKRGMPVIDIHGTSYGVTLGEDAKRCVALYPQSTARGVLTEASFPLFDPEHPLADRCYIGDVYYGETPLRAPIHDSLFMEVPTRKVDRVIERTAYAMQRPVEALPCPLEWGIGAHLTIGVDAKIGLDWGSMSSVELPAFDWATWQDVELAADTPYTPAEDEDEEDVEALETAMGAVA